MSITHYRYNFAVEPHRRARGRLLVWQERIDRSAPRLTQNAITGTVDIALVQGRWEPVQLTVGPDPAAPETAEVSALTSAAIRNVPIGEIVEKALTLDADELRVQMAEHDVDHKPEVIRKSFERRLAEAEKAASQRRRGPKGHGPGFYAEVASVYMDAYPLGNPTDAVAKRFKTSRSTAATWVAKARSLGLLDPTTRGRPGGVVQATKKTTKKTSKRTKRTTRGKKR